MHAAFVRESRAPDEGGAGEMGVIGNVVHKPRQVTQTFETRHDLQPHFQLKDGNDGGEVAISRALAVAVDRALDLCCARVHGRDRVGDAEFAVVVGVDTDGGAGKVGAHGHADRGDLGG